MDQSNDDLQNAINGIVAGGAEGAAPAMPEAPVPEAAGMPDLGMPPMPPAPEAGASLDMTLPTPEASVTETPASEIPQIPEPGADLMNQAPASIEEQVAAEATPEMPVESAPVAPETAPEVAQDVTESVMGMPEAAPAGNTELSSVKQSMIQDLIPLMDKVSLDADKKFDLYKEVIDSTHDKTMVPAAYEAAKGIADDTAKAEALLYLINESDS